MLYILIANHNALEVLRPPHEQLVQLPLQKKGVIQVEWGDNMHNIMLADVIFCEAKMER